MEREWVENHQPSKGEIAVASAVIFVILAMLPVMIGLALYSDSSAEEQGQLCCPVFIIVITLIFLASWMVVSSSYKTVTHVGFSHNGIMIRHRSTESVVLEWADIKGMDPTENRTWPEYTVRYRNPVTGQEAAEIMDAGIANLIRSGIDKAKMPEDRRFCPGCGRKNDGWAYCPDCGKGWGT